jgi:hypothetical protein
MYLVLFIRKLLSLPFYWGGQLAGMFQTPLSVSLFKAAWLISADGQTGFTAMTVMTKYAPPSQVIACALGWMEKTPRVEIAAYAGFLAAMEGDERTARDMLARCGDFDKDHIGLIEMLDYSIAQRFEPLGSATACARRLETQDDVSPTVSVMIHTELLWDDMLSRRFDEVKRRSDLMLAVGPAPGASIAAAGIARRQGNESRALQHDDQAMKLPREQWYYFHFLTAWAMELHREADDYMAKLIECDGALAEYARRRVLIAGGAMR